MRNSLKRSTLGERENLQMPKSDGLGSWCRIVYIIHEAMESEYFQVWKMSEQGMYVGRRS
ncbi:uncharacterized protein STEHIDRAFT_125098, partial [Stereum hirsutum FP-91666 SS1]|uniref:uncharacterized protein n=1 Tax=Stereum hirsutum (strain FP-91666) TaxID=721885 RepID=UPI000444926C